MIQIAASSSISRVLISLQLAFEPDGFLVVVPVQRIRWRRSPHRAAHYSTTPPYVQGPHLLGEGWTLTLLGVICLLLLFRCEAAVSNFQNPSNRLSSHSW